jgi:uncharacterized membrane protein
MTFVLANLLERLLGLNPGFLSRNGEFGVDFNPRWPGPGALTPYWNVSLAAVVVLWVLWVYWRDGRSRPVRVTLGAVRLLLLGFVLFLLNNPVLTLGQSRVEPSVLAVMIDDSVSMRVKDVAGSGTSSDGPTRLEAAIDLLNGKDQALLKELAKKHQLRLFKFDQDARPLGASAGKGNVVEDAAGPKPADPNAKPPEIRIDPSVVKAIADLKPEGQNTQVVRSLMTVLDELQGQRLAGVVVISDGRETPASASPEVLKALQNYGVKVYPVAVGSDRAPQNVDVQAVGVQDSAFKDDIVNFKMTVRGTGYEPGKQVKLTLKDKKTGNPLRTADGKPAEATVTLVDGKPVEQEILFKPEREGALDIVAEAEKQAGELDPDDNIRTAAVSILDAKIAVLYVDGYPRWEYRYVKNEMIRDRSVLISCLLTSADPSFAQEGDPPADRFPGPIRRFPESIEELMSYDVVLFGDVDPRQFTDSQLQLISDFVSKKGGGFGMIAGTHWSPSAYKNTALDALLPVNISRAVVEAQGAEVGVITEGFRPTPTKEGWNSSVFRFFPDKAENERYVKDDLQPVFWYQQGVTTKPGVGEVYAEHPGDVGPDGRKAPVLVMGRFGAGRTMFSAIDDTWRWRFYTGESVFDTYWVQQLRYLARSKKLGQRRLTFDANRKVYELGDQVNLRLRVLDPVLLQQLPAEIRVEVMNDKGQPVRTERLQKLEGAGNEVYETSFTADRLGSFRLKLPPFSGEAASLEQDFRVEIPRLELAQPQVDRALVSRVAADTLGATVAFADAREKLPQLIPSAAKVIPVTTSEPLWDAPLAMWIFVLLLSGEWVLRKAFGML